MMCKNSVAKFACVVGKSINELLPRCGVIKKTACGSLSWRTFRCFLTQIT